jgi:hypothetical protein
MDTDWTENQTPDEAQAALEALNANKAPVTAREATYQAASCAAGEGGYGRIGSRGKQIVPSATGGCQPTKA